MTKQYIVYADGACSGNPGPGGWAFEIQTPDGRTFTGAGGSPATTNNIMELTAAAAALEKLAEEQFFLLPEDVSLRLDSQYVLDGLFQWLPNWKAKGWKTAGKKPVKNRELWERLDAAHMKLLSVGFAVQPNWVKGHDGEAGNERVDTAAQEQRDQFALAPKSSILANAAEAAGIPIVDVPVGKAAQVLEEADSFSMQNQPEPLRNPTACIDPLRYTLPPRLTSAPQDESINSMQVDLMRTILELHASGDYSVKKVIQEIRANAVALGCR